MKIIRQENKWFASHLMRQPHKDSVYRCSKFVIRIDIYNGFLLYNVLTGALYLFQNEDEESSMDLLIENWFYLPEDFNELDWVDFLREKKRKKKDSDVISGYTIMTTLDCNARCFYCYEKGRTRTMMTEQTAVDLANYIINHAKGKSIHFSWFGGEPLFNYKVIDIITEKTSTAKLSFNSSMISNGLLFSPSLVDKAVKQWNLKRIQITLDGTKEVYQKSKAYVNSDGNEFEKVLDNIELLLKNDIVVYVRLNQDVHNTDDLLNLIDLLKERFSKYPKFKVYNHLLFSLDNVVSEEQQDCYYKLRKKIESANVSFKPKLISGPKINNCMADSQNSRVVTPDGKIGKCEHFSSENLVGSLRQGTIDEEMMKKWAERIERQEECYNCPLFPVCNKIKMCPNEGSRCSLFDRETKLYSLKQAIMNTYKQYCLKVKRQKN